MKITNILTVLAGICVMSVGCRNEIQPAHLEELQISQSYIAIPAVGGSKTVMVKATDSWTFDIPVVIDGEPYLDDVKGIVTPKLQVSVLDTKPNKWFEISPISGKAGATAVTFIADKTVESHISNIVVKVGDKTQNIVVAQIGSAVEVPVISVREAEAAVGSIVRIKGTCTNISSTAYGNWYLKDENGDTMYIYGTVDASGSYNWNALNIAVGDVVTVQGPSTFYNGTYELVDASVINVQKSLILSENSRNTVGKMAGSLNVKLQIAEGYERLTYDSQCEWLSIDGLTADGNDFTFTISVRENPYDVSRTGSVVFLAAKGKDVTEFPIEIMQLGSTPVKGNIGTISDIVASGTSESKACFDVILEDAVVTYVNGSNIFIEDSAESGIDPDKRRGLLIYDSDCKLIAGDHVSGRVYGYGCSYNNLPEVTAFNSELALVNKKEVPVPVALTVKELIDNYSLYLSRYVTVSGTLSKDVNVKFPAITSAGELTDGENVIAFKPQSSGKFNGKKIYFYSQVGKNAEVELTTNPGIDGTAVSLNFWDPKQLVVKKSGDALP